jgi:hypothetical protein
MTLDHLFLVLKLSEILEPSRPNEATRRAASLGIAFDFDAGSYFAYSTARVSRMTVTLICPG